MNINHNAPLTAKEEITIAAPLARVWATLTNIEGWPEWQPEVSSAKLEGSLAVGTVFRWTANSLPIVSTIQDLEPGRRIGWIGRSLGMGAIHIWTLEPSDEATRVTTEESLSGWLARILKVIDPHFLKKSLIGSLQVLKAQAER